MRNPRNVSLVLKQAFDIWQRLTDIPSQDPDDSRRRRLLNILLICLNFCTLLILIILVALEVTGFTQQFQLERRIITLIVVTLIVLGLIYHLNRAVSGRAASLVLLLYLTGILFVGDSPHELVYGRSTIYFVLPIMMASMLLRPSASFIVAGVILVGHTGLALSMHAFPNFLTGAIYVSTALVSWLASHTLERTLKDLRSVNRDLDERVVAGTRELHAILQRELVEAGKNRAILESLGDSVLVFNLDGNLASANPAFLRLVGRGLPQLIGRPAEDLIRQIAPAQQDIVRKMFRECTALTSAHLDWGGRTLAFHISPFFLGGDQIAGKVAVLHDITHEVEISRMKSTFVAMVSHELRTPLAAIMGLLEILQQDIYGPLAEKQREVVNRLMSNTHKLAQLVGDLLDHAQIEAGVIAIKDVPFTPADLMNGMVETAGTLAAARNLELVTCIESEVPGALLGDPNRLAQVLTNLVTNALKFTEQGQVRARIYRPQAAKWALAVSDTGPGIPPEFRDRLFDPFSQADSSMGRKHGGFGLGLSIVHRLVVLMNGEIQVETEMGEGTTFTVLLPLRLPAETEPQKAEPAVSA